MAWIHTENKFYHGFLGKAYIFLVKWIDDCAECEGILISNFNVLDE